MDGHTARSPSPDQLCDLVMKGGITSGMAYPEAIGALKDSYRFRNIGGASAGAIAAAATAAAEYGRDRGGFERLTGLGEELTKDNALRSLFQPTPAARPAFNLLLRLQQERKKDRVTSGIGRVLTAVLALARGLWWWPLLGVAAGVLLVLAASGGALFAPWPRVVALVIAMLVGGMLGLAAGTALRAWTLVTRHLPASFYGMCTGMTAEKAGTAALTPWLHDQLQQMAGRTAADPPLTFRDLADVELPVDFGEAGGDVPGVQLQMMTTDVTLGRPLRLPLADDTRYFFSPEEFGRLLPAKVVEYLSRPDVSEPYAKVVDGGRPPPDDGMPPDLRTLPHDRLPIIVATRMSLSFPVLLSAIPLYTHRPAGEHHWVRHWLSDGGIGSNFPIHFFDALVPRWPTFALRFVPERTQHDSGPNGDSRHRPEFQPVARRGQIDSLSAFLAAILDTMQNWRDTLQSELPGFRDRIEDIELKADQGGMNLTMPPDTIEDVRRQGKDAGERLVKNFRWTSHRFLRYAMTMRLLDDTLGADRLARAYRFGGFDQEIHADIRTVVAELERANLHKLAGDLERRYPPEWCAWACERTKKLLDAVDEWRKGHNGETFSGEPLPTPSSVLRVGPSV